MNFFSLKCPHCKAELSTENGLDTFFCPYCGGKVILEGQNEEVLRAKIREYDSLRRKREADEELEREYKRKEKEMEYNRKKEIEHDKAVFRSFRPFIIFIICIITLIFVMDRLEVKEQKKQQQLIEKMQDKTVTIGISSRDFENMNYYDARNYLKKCGFIYIDELKIEHRESDNKIKASIAYISIDGKKEFDAGTVFPLDAKIQIAYYSYSYSS